MPPKKTPEPLDISTPDAPKHFVRTLESDSAAVRQGSKPDFAEVKTSEEPEEKVATEEKELPPPRPLPPPPPPPAVPEEMIIEKTPAEPAKSRLFGDAIFPTFSSKKPAEPAVALTPPTAPQPVEQAKAPLRTYTSDFAAHINETKASTATVLAAESDAAKQPAPSTGSVYNIPLIVGGLLLIALGGGGAYAAYLFVNAPPPITTTPLAPTLIFVNDREEISGEGAELVAAMTASLAKTLAAGGVRLLSLRVSTSTVSSVFHALQLPAPNILLRNITASESIAGVVNADGTPAPFFILRVESYTDTFAGMLAWEPRMRLDLNELFPSTATSTRPFRDEILSNHDIRVLRDESGESIVLYGYANPSTLLIARNESAYTELLERLSNSRTTR